MAGHSAFPFTLAIRLEMLPLFEIMERFSGLHESPAYSDRKTMSHRRARETGSTHLGQNELPCPERDLDAGTHTPELGFRTHMPIDGELDTVAGLHS
ncbi:hypothetical protein PLEOSDRAFT_1090216 [Pleurotus ostreatus PC15]|uniref:Uncharacterized protein n=1 Tax=Pleurotus ostreatus (strain PC15) TaxID=1137138 RepID=A0A067NDB7_PLEO1|nr:hypothetical protein PLEOSDRAFT_1090216 [Pleurotus ostreatus PC15]